MIHKEEDGSFTVYCDNCNEFHESRHYDKDEAWGACEEDNWYIEKNNLGWVQHYCPNCDKESED